MVKLRAADLICLRGGKIKTAKISALTVGTAGIIVIIGWIFNIEFLKSISPSWISMKFTTALAFVASGITLYFIARNREGEPDKSQIVLSITSLVIIIIMGVLFLSALLGIHTGTEDLIVKETNISPMSVIPGRPSLPTMLNFILIALAGIFTILDNKILQVKLKIIGSIVAVIGAIAVTGYIFNRPDLYYFIEGLNSAMALHTAILFVIMGAGLICLSD